MSEPSRPAPSTRLLLGLFGAVVLCVYHPLLLGKALLGRDVLRWILPARFVLREALARHRLPEWNPWQGLGFATLSDPLYGPFYLPTLLTLPGPLVPSTMLFMLAHMLSGGVGSFFLARRLNATGPAALLAALAWSLSGYIAADWTTGIRLLSSSYFPWSALAWLALARASRDPQARLWRWAPVAALPSALVFLTGEVFLALIIAGFGLLISLAELDFNDRPGLTRFGLAALAALGLTALSGAVAVLPAAALAASTDRAMPLGDAMANNYTLFPARIIELVAPGGIGLAQMYVPARAAHYTHGNLLNLSLYMGAVPFALCLCAPYKQRLPRVLAALAIVLVLLALGPATPLLPLLRLVVRPLAYMRAPEKFLAGVVPLVAALSALGTTRLLDGTPWPWRRLALFAALLAAYAALSSSLYTAPIAPFIVAGCVRSAVFVLGVLAVVRFARPRPLVAVGLLALMLSLDDGQFLANFHNYAPSSVVTRAPLALRAVNVSARAPAPLRVFRSESLDDVLDAARLAPGRSAVVDSLHDNTSVMVGVGIVPGYDAAMPSILNTVLASHRRDALRLLAVDYALLSAPSPDPHAVRPGITEVDAPLPGVRLYRVERSLPRAFLAGSVVRRPLRDLDAHLLDADVVDGRVALVTDPSPVPAGEATALTPCILERYEPGEITARCFAARPTLAVFVEQHTPGWSATVDGRSASVMQADRLLLGVPVSAGLHRIELRYRTPGLRLGGLLSLLAWAVIAAALAALWAERRRESA